ncbi:hypothetical protein [Carboxylicivirga marina]|uniref:Apea-like HEPN domain-containing protein n=1 Tax=Carboxylicivirga marina TaxID=2800988 RepID=A0ABS1HR46_9BACT|nr:hypothetical protein [Carboxylicivirga marina]MBK3519718.1 hypothetical protein [Carboxylicivirga marina]
MTYSKKRIEYNNKWPDKVIMFSGQEAFINLLNEKDIQNILCPIQLPLINDFQFQRLLSFKIDIYEQLPQRPDIAFDLAWRTFEAYATYFSKKGNWNTTKSWKILNKVSEDILENQYNQSDDLNDAFEELVKSIPLQAAEFLIKRLFEHEPASIKSQQTQIIDRVKDSMGNELFNAIQNKYGELTPADQRKAGMLLQIILSGKEIDLNGVKFRLDRISIAKLVINGILYTYRNERFHGDSFSPFKSSKTQIKTYAHSYYLLISTYFFISQLIYKHFPELFDLDLIANQLRENTIRYNQVFEKYKKR